MLFNLHSDNNTILSCFFFFILIIDLHFLIPAVTGQIFNPIGELVNSKRIPSKEEKAEIEISSV